MNSELAIAEYGLFGKDRTSGLKRDVDIMVNDIILSVSYPLPDIHPNYILAIATCPLESRVTFPCIYRPLGVTRKLIPLLALFTSLFNGPLSFFLMGDLNARHANWDTLQWTLDINQSNISDPCAKLPCFPACTSPPLLVT